MKDSVKHCYNCQFFKSYYTKGVKQFNKCNFGYCSQKGEIQFLDKHESCNKFELKEKQQRYNTFIKRCLNDLLTEITAIRAVMEEEKHGKEDL